MTALDGATVKQDNSGEIVACRRYRSMILRLLEDGHKTNIPQDIRNAAYDLLDEYFEAGGDDEKEWGRMIADLNGRTDGS